jgi:hypothetical protein
MHELINVTPSKELVDEILGNYGYELNIEYDLKLIPLIVKIRFNQYIAKKVMALHGYIETINKVHFVTDEGTFYKQKISNELLNMLIEEVNFRVMLNII